MSNEEVKPKETKPAAENSPLAVIGEKSDDEQSEKKQQSNFWIILIAVAVYFVLTIINFWALNAYKNDTETLIKNSALQNINQATDFLKNNSQIVVLEEEIERAKLEIDSNYRDFLMKYYETQNNCLTMWLAALGIILAVFGVVIPLCFMKLFENKREEMNQVIHDVKDIRSEAKGCLDEVNKAKNRVVDEIEDKRKDVKKLTKEYDALKAQVDEDANSLKTVVAESKKTMEEYKKIEKEIMGKAKTITEQAKVITEQAQQVSEDKNVTEANKYFVMGANLYNDEKYDEALENFNNVLRLYAEGKVPFGKIGTLYHYIAGANFYKEDYKEAEYFFTKALDVVPDNMTFLTNRAKCFMKLKEYKKAQQDAEKAISLDSNASDGYSALSVVYGEQGNNVEAKKYILKAIELSERDAVNYCGLGVYCMRLGEVDEARAALLKAVNLDQNYPNTFYNLIEVYLLEKSFISALESLKSYIEKEKHPYITALDYEYWPKLLDKAESNEDKKTAEEIRELIETKLIKKQRGD